jgi:hypothetical protein
MKLALLMFGVVVAAALSATPPARADDAPAPVESWKTTCDATRCLLVGDIPHGEQEPLRHMTIVVATGRGGAVSSITFRLPPDADKGKLFAVGFLDTTRDASGNWQPQVVDGATRILEVRDCSSDACVVSLPGGIIEAQEGSPAFDFGRAMTEHNLLLTFYFSHGERIRASSALFRFKAAYADAKRQLP